ncbi:hypothetical protein KEJ24_02195 [Candidatus Bathyarchaeota archaeon]|nr:hypothetical protein [Candidatus Bathyarchaeota archaeon]
MKFLVNYVIRFARRSIRLIRRFWKTILLVVYVSLATLLLNMGVSIWLSSFHGLYLPSVGNIHVIGVEASGGDIRTLPNGSQFINWGTVYLGARTDRLFYLKSISNKPIILELTSSNLTFQNSKGDIVKEPLPVENPLRLSWNYTGVPLEPNERICVILTLEVSSDPRFIAYIVENDVEQFHFIVTIKPLSQA